MADLREQLEQLFRGRVCLMGLGNLDSGDDGVGVRLAEALKAEGLSHVISAGARPERYVSQVAEAGFDNLIFLDAAEFGAVPGSVVLLNSEEMAARFPQISTHTLSLGLLAKGAEANGKTKAWLLGVQPESFRAGESLTTAVQATLQLLLELLTEEARA